MSQKKPGFINWVLRKLQTSCRIPEYLINVITYKLDIMRSIGVIKTFISEWCSFIMLVPERMEHFDFASTCGVETLPETILPADRCLWSRIEGCATAANRRGLHIAGIPEPDFPERRDTLEEGFGQNMGPGFPPFLPSGETLCARDRPSTTVTGMHERLQCTNYSLAPFSPMNSL